MRLIELREPEDGLNSKEGCVVKEENGWRVGIEVY